jgi:hypothetical protein
MKIVGLGNALVDVLLKLENDSVLSEIGVKKGAMDLIDKELHNRGTYTHCRYRSMDRTRTIIRMEKL